MQNLKAACKELCVSFSRTSTKEDLLCSLGRFCLKNLDIHTGIDNIYVYSTCKTYRIFNVDSENNLQLKAK